jgi:outer membrane murein-binding lipoprotein Lpp
MGKQLLSLSAVILGLALLSGCGNSDKPSQSPQLKPQVKEEAPSLPKMDQ